MRRAKQPWCHAGASMIAWFQREITAHVRWRPEVELTVEVSCFDRVASSTTRGPAPASFDMLPT